MRGSCNIVVWVAITVYPLGRTGLKLLTLTLTALKPSPYSNRNPAHHNCAHRSYVWLPLFPLLKRQVAIGKERRFSTNEPCILTLTLPLAPALRPILVNTYPNPTNPNPSNPAKNTSKITCEQI